MTICRRHPKYRAFRAPTADCETCRRIWAATPEQRRLRRNEYQREYRRRPGRREADALASRKSYWRSRGDWLDGCQCDYCTSLGLRGFRMAS